MRIYETFVSLQGEGLLMGLPTLFIRTVGCNLDCIWCDTRYAFEGGREMAPDELVGIAGSTPVRDVCITGGEPLLQKELVELCGKLIVSGKRVSVETNGSLDVGPLVALGDPLLISMDVKCPGSGMSEHNHLSNLAILREHDQVKFTVSMEDMGFVRSVLHEHSTLASVIVQPVFGEDPEELAREILDSGLNVRFLLQMHKYVWPPGTRGV